MNDYPAYNDLTAAQKAALNTQIFQDKPSSLWPVGGNSWNTNIPPANPDWPSYVVSGNAHGGTDIGAKEGIEIYSIYYGTAYAKTQLNSDGSIGAGGKYVYVTSSINDETVQISYMHMSNWAFPEGTSIEVQPGQIIGYVGHTGNAGDPPYNHVHFQVNFSPNVQNPYNYLPNIPNK